MNDTYAFISIFTEFENVNMQYLYFSFLLLKTFDKESCFGVRQVSGENDFAVNFVIPEGKRENLLESHFSKYLTGEEAAGMHCDHLQCQC